MLFRTHVDSLKGEHLDNAKFFVQTCFFDKEEKFKLDDNTDALFVDRFDRRVNEWIEFCDFIRIWSVKEVWYKISKIITQSEKRYLYSDKYYDCVGLVGIWYDRKLNENIAFLSHIDPKFLYYIYLLKRFIRYRYFYYILFWGKEKFFNFLKKYFYVGDNLSFKQLYKFLKNKEELFEDNINRVLTILKERSIHWSIDIVIIWWWTLKFQMYTYLVKKLGNIVKKKFWFYPVVVWWPSFVEEENSWENYSKSIYFDVKNRRIYLNKWKCKVYVNFISNELIKILK